MVSVRKIGKGYQYYFDIQGFIWYILNKLNVRKIYCEQVI